MCNISNAMDYKALVDTNTSDTTISLTKDPFTSSLL